MGTSDRRLRPRKLPRQARSERTRQWILEAAAQVVAEHGYAAGTTNRIAERAGVSIGSVYQYYPNKDAILVELMSAHVESGLAALWALVEGGLPEALDDLIRVFVRATVDNHRDEPALHRVLFEETPRPPSFVQALHEAEAAVVAVAAGMLAAHPEVRVADTGTAARIVVATIESLVHRLVAARVPVDPQVVEDELVLMLVRYLTAGT